MDPFKLKTGGVTTPATMGGSSFAVAPKNDAFSIFNTPPKTEEVPKTGGSAPVAKAPADQSGFTPSGLFINSDGSVNLEKSLASAQASLKKIQDDAAKLAAAQTPATASTSYVSSSEAAVNREKDTATEVANLSAPNPNLDAAKVASEAYMKTLQDEYDALEKRRAQEVEQINKAFDVTKANTEEAQKREAGTTNVAIMRTGGYLGTQISGVGVLNNLATTHRQEISALEGKRAAAISEANNAITDKQFAIARLKAAEVKDLDKEINNRRNEFFNQSMQIVQEERLKSASEETKRQNAFKNALDTIDRVAPTLVQSIEGMDEAGARNYLLGAARDLNLDPNLLIGEVNAITSDRLKEERKEVFTLAQKYPSAAIDPNTDSFTSASEKIRGSKEYKLDIAKAEADLSNTRSIINQRASDNAVDYADPILRMYTQATGDIATSPSKARAILGYADSLLSGKEVVGDDYDGPLLDNQIKASDARNMITSSFTQLSKTDGSSDSIVWNWLATPEAQGLDDESKKTKIMRDYGKNPEDFGIY